MKRSTLFVAVLALVLCSCQTIDENNSGDDDRSKEEIYGTVFWDSPVVREDKLDFEHTIYWIPVVSETRERAELFYYYTSSNNSGYYGLLYRIGDSDSYIDVVSARIRTGSKISVLRQIDKSQAIEPFVPSSINKLYVDQTFWYIEKNDIRNAMIEGLEIELTTKSDEKYLAAMDEKPAERVTILYKYLSDKGLQ